MLGVGDAMASKAQCDAMAEPEDGSGSRGRRGGGGEEIGR